MQFNPTPHKELNNVLEEMALCARNILGDDLIGVYLQGSFAVGDFDENSDVDFITVLGHDINKSTLPRLQSLHARIHQLPTKWAQRLDGSYVPKDVFRRWTTDPRDPPDEPRDANWRDPGMNGTSAHVYPFYYLDNGASVLQRSEHDNSQVVRWVVRERGITIYGPKPTEIIELVSQEQLRAEIAVNLSKYAAPYIEDPERLNPRWLAAFFVVLYCRMRHSLRTGEIRSKQAGVTWALQTLDDRWHNLIEAAWLRRQENLKSLIRATSSQEIQETADFLDEAIKSLPAS